MQNARVTFLTTPDRKAAIEAKAAELGVSSGEYIRLAVDNFDQASAEDEAELAALVEEVNRAIPKMNATIDGMIKTLDDTHRDMDRMLREVGIRK